MSKNTLSWLLLIALGCIWGSSFILMKRGMFALDGTPLFSHTQVAALRMSIAGLAVLPFTLYFLRKITAWKQVLSLATVGICGNFLPAFLFTYSETGLSSGIAGMLNSLTPVFTLLIGSLVFRQRLTFLQITGVFVAGLGTVLLMLAGKDLSISGSVWHALAIVLATFFYGISLNTVKYTLSAFRSLEITSLAFGVILIPALLTAWQSGAVETLREVPQAWEGFGFICILSLVGTVVALVIYNRLIAVSSTLFASSVTYFMPIVAVILGTLDGERINFRQTISMVIILSGVFIANYLASLSERKKNRSGS